jgi:hypothetical protein
MPWNERLCIINNLSMVDEVYTFDDDDGSAKHFIQQARAHYPDSELIFANGGDRTKDNIPEMDAADTNTKFVFGVGGDDKKNSSSWILEEWKAPKTLRTWDIIVCYMKCQEPRSKNLQLYQGNDSAFNAITTVPSTGI